jgi:predicted CXXCH cytochrome family protein
MWGSSQAAAEKAEDICYACHTESELAGGYRECRVWVRNGHPVYVVPSKAVRIPKEFPLNDKGQIFCGTCHTAGVINRDSTDRQPYIYSRKVFLRYENVNSSFCKQCHINKGGGRSAISGPQEGYELIHEPAAAEVERKQTDKSFNHPVDINTTRIPKKLIEFGGSAGTSKDMLICETCHRVHRAADRNLLVLNNSNSELCGICHPRTWAMDREGASAKGTHPVNILPSTAIISTKVTKEGGRVEGRGKMVCSTCHQVHNSLVGKGLLVMSNYRDAFCIECHSVEERAVRNTKHDLRRSAPREKNILNQPAGKTGPCSPCHLAHNGTGAKIWARRIVNPEADAISQLCQSCHSPFNCAQHKLTGRFSHPLNVELKNAPELRAKLPLFSRNGIRVGIGLVTCASCHDAHRWDPKSGAKTIRAEGDNTNSFLRMRNLKSAICYQCHPEKRLIRRTKHDPTLHRSEQATGKRGLCEECHSVHNANSYMLWNRELGPGEDNLSKICNSCHRKGGIAQAKVLDGYNHPVNVNILRLGRYISTDLPLFDDHLSPRDPGNILCNTCHDTHRWNPKVAVIKDFTTATATADTSFLRIAANADNDSLCDNCHIDKAWIKLTEHDLSVTAPDEKNLQGKTTAQTGVCGACHATHRGLNPFVLWNRKPGAGEDQQTKLCNSCHAEGGIAHRKQIGANSHPLGIPMPDNRSPRHLPLFDENLRVDPQGKIYCSTCHNPHQWDANQMASGPGRNQEGDGATSFLRISNDEGYRLCIDCHPDKELVEGTEHDLSVSAPQARNILGQSVEQSGLCAACHLPHNSVAAQQLWARELGSGGDVISRLCNSCHAKNRCAESKIIGPNSHPLNASILAADSQTDLPLFTPEGKRDDDRGGVTCSTCHNSHQWDPMLHARGNGKPVEGSQQTSFLRLPNTPKPLLCGNCHQQHLRIQASPHDLSTTAPLEKNLLGQTAGEGGICSPCHLPHNSPSSIRMWARQPGPGSLPGWEEKYAAQEHYGVVLCTSCHAAGGIAQTKLPPRALHPKNVFVLLKEAALTPAAQALPYFDYPLGQTKLRVSTSAILAGVKPRFPLLTPDGRISQAGDITCPTCHDPHRLASAAGGAASSLPETHLQQSFLRQDVASNLCTDCHKYEAIYRFAYYHRRRIPSTTRKPPAADSPHWKRGKCSACHTSSKPGRNTLKAGGDINALCNQCHQEKHNREVHPTGIPVSSAGLKQPKSLPLADNRINCLTCHQLEKHQQADKSPLDKNPYFLRQAGEEVLNFFSQQKKASDSTYSLARMQTSLSQEQPATPEKSGEEKEQKEYPYTLCYECHPQENYRQFDPHRYQLVDEGTINREMCLLCHSDIPNLFTTDPKEFKLKAKLEDYCIGCHSEQVKAHPMRKDHYGKRVSKEFYDIINSFGNIAAYFIPLSNERLVCTTCHNPHQRGVSHNKAAMKGEDERWRLRFVGYEMCNICHRRFGKPAQESPF